MLVGYATAHDGDCYEMWNPATGTIYVTRDAIWLQRMYFGPGLDMGDVPILPIDEIDNDNEQVMDLASRKGEIGENFAQKICHKLKFHIKICHNLKFHN